LPVTRHLILAFRLCCWVLLLLLMLLACGVCWAGILGWPRAIKKIPASEGQTAGIWAIAGGNTKIKARGNRHQPTP
jgi:hypothetical protein